MARRGGSGVLVSWKINSLFLIMILVIFEFFQFALFYHSVPEVLQKHNCERIYLTWAGFNNKEVGIGWMVI